MKDIDTTAKPGISYWFKETFRLHSKKEYVEFFSRGLDGDERLNKVYPWLYMRAFAFCAVLFALFTFIVFMTTKFVDHEAIRIFGYPSLLTVGGTLLNIPLLFLVYELYPKRDLSFIKLCITMIACVAVCDLLVNLGYCALLPKNEWLSNLWAVCLEEFSKALPAVIAILVLKVRNPMGGFLIGAAVGIGMSVSEDIGYIFVASWNEGVDIPALLLVTLARSFTSIAGHLVWTGLISWAFVKFNRPFINYKFYACCLASLALHYVFNCPYAPISAITLGLSVGAGLIILIYLPKHERKLAFRQSIISGDEQWQSN